MRRLELHRDIDITGISGVGTVAEGVQFSDGTCAIRWVGTRSSTVIWSSVADLLSVHGHNGATRIIWVD